MKKRYYVEPIDNIDALDPAPPRRWAVVDRALGQQRSEHDRRDDARVEAHQLNNEES